MFSNDDNSGLGTFLACMIVLVLAGVALSLVFDGNLKFSRNKQNLLEDLQAGELEVSHLRQELSTFEARLTEEGDARRRSGDSLKVARQAAELASNRKKALGESLESLKSACAGIEAGFSAYRVKYRENRWKQSVGRSLGEVRLTNGREFRQAVIAGVTADGLEIRHESGTARLAASDLDPALRDEFQWDLMDPRVGDSANTNRSSEEAKKPELVARPGGSPDAERRSEPSRDDTQIAALRTKVQVWKSRLLSLKSQRAEATSKASYGGEKSVPGSLETWAQRASALSVQVARAETELARAKAALGLLAPDDPLLRGAGE